MDKRTKTATKLNGRYLKHKEIFNPKPATTPKLERLAAKPVKKRSKCVRKTGYNYE